MPLPDREDALALLHEYTKSVSLRRHALAVEAAMRAYARRYAADRPNDPEVDEHYWGLVGLLHDFDYEIHPQAPEHPTKGEPILAEHGYPEDFRRAILSHASYTGIPRERLVEKVLFAVDELCGFLMAVALVRPGQTLAGLKPSSVRKKLKDKAFARTVNREEVAQGMEELGLAFEDHVAFTAQALHEIAPDLGLSREAPAAG